MPQIEFESALRMRTSEYSEHLDVICKFELLLILILTIITISKIRLVQTTLSAFYMC